MIEDGGAGASDAGKIPILIEARLRDTSTACPKEVQQRVRGLISKRSILYRDGPLPISPGEEPFLEAHLEELRTCDTLLHQSALQGARLLFWQVELQIYVFQLNDEGPADTDGDDGASPSCCEWQIPALALHGLWEALIYDGCIKQRLLQYAATALHFGRVGVNSHLVSFNRTVLLHGPPGTGKTSLCKALAQKLAIRFSDRYAHSQMIEVNAHSLFSKWFSESGKLVTALFTRIREAVEEEDTLVFVLIDEVESLTAARKAAVSGSEPADAIRAVNALLTALDSLRGFPNVMLLTTSNLAQAIDVAFVDRADIKAYLGPPGLQGRYEILRSCLAELQRTGILSASSQLPVPFLDLKPASLQPCSLEHSQSNAMGHGQPEAAAAQTAGEKLKTVALLCEGFSGRTLRKLPFLAYVAGEEGFASVRTGIPVGHFLDTLRIAVEKEKRDRELMEEVLEE